MVFGVVDEDDLVEEWDQDVCLEAELEVLLLADRIGLLELEVGFCVEVELSVRECGIENREV